VAHIRHVITVGLALAAAGFPHAGAQNVPSDADAILSNVISHLRGGGQQATVEMQVEDETGVKVYQLEIISDGERRSLTRVLAPPREAGQAFLVNGEDLFVYAPRLGRSLRLPPSGRSDGFLGSDLSYDDLAGDEVTRDFDATIAARSDDALTLSLTPRAGAATPYGELRFKIRLPDLAPLELTYYDQRDTAVKRMILSNFRSGPGAAPVPSRFEVVDLTPGGGRTVARWLEAEFGVMPPDRCFTLEALERGCRW
jgi:outer membrane lipoprotein-sorting protein